MLEAIDLTCVRDERRLFQQMSFCVAAGEIVQIEGQNGAGKTSLLRILAGLTEADEGQVNWLGGNIHHNRIRYHQDLLFLSHQRGINAALTPFENLVFYQSAGGKIDNDAIWWALAQVGLAGYEDLPLSQLSAGQQHRVALARLWLSQAPLWILDEPLTAIDKQGVSTLLSLFVQHTRQGGMILLATHQHLNSLSQNVRSIRLTNTWEH